MKLKRWMKWMIANTGVAASAYYGLWHGVDGAANVLQFYIWFAFTVSLFALSDEFVRAAQKKNGLPVVPAWLDVSFDLCIVLALAWNGWMWSASAFVFHMIFMSKFRELKPEKKQVDEQPA